MTIKIAIDAMGGDKAPRVVIEGVAFSAVRHPDIFFLIYGQQEIVSPLIALHPCLTGRCELIHTEEMVAMDDKPAAILRRGQKTSMWQAITAVLDKKADAIVSAGNTGALMAMSKLRLRMLEGIDRPALASLWPTLHGECVMLDVGATIEANSRQLFEFALMGSAYARILFDKQSPTVGLLNVGSEDMKGNDIVRHADSILREYQGNFHYHGFVEGDDITRGVTDVIVTDGFTGNIALKTAEGVAHLIGSYLKYSLISTLTGKIGAWIAKSNLHAFKEKINPKRVNGAVFLGLTGLVVKSHGGTDSYGFAAALDLAIDLAKGNITQTIKKEIEKNAE